MICHETNENSPVGPVEVLDSINIFDIKVIYISKCARNIEFTGEFLNYYISPATGIKPAGFLAGKAF